MIVFLIFGCTLSLSTNAEAARLDPVVNCQIVAGQNTRVVCKAAGLVVLDTAINLPTVTLPPITVTLPPVVRNGPTRTVTVTIPGAVKTSTATSVTTITATATKTVQAPRATSEATVRVTKTATPESVTVTEPGQTATTYVTVGVPTQAPDSGDVAIPLPDNKVLKAAVGFGYLIGLIAIIICVLWAGYYLGHRHSDNQNLTFLRVMSDQLLVRKR